MAKYIDANLFFKALANGHLDGSITGPEDVEKLVREFTAADVKEVIRGKWKGQSSEDEDFCECSECGHYQYDDSKFCPNCGSDMRGVK